jgi:hypothetical protein
MDLCGQTFLPSKSSEVVDIPEINLECTGRVIDGGTALQMDFLFFMFFFNRETRRKITEGSKKAISGTSEGSFDSGKEICSVDCSANVLPHSATEVQKSPTVHAKKQLLRSNFFGLGLRTVRSYRYVGGIDANHPIRQIRYSISFVIAWHSSCPHSRTCNCVSKEKAGCHSVRVMKNCVILSSWLRTGGHHAIISKQKSENGNLKSRELYKIKRKHINITLSLLSI